jgi:hypothetical protein
MTSSVTDAMLAAGLRAPCLGLPRQRETPYAYVRTEMLLEVFGTPEALDEMSTNPLRSA